MNGAKLPALAGLVLAAALLPLAAHAETQTVTIEGMQFKPQVITVKRGDTIVWRNRDVVPHTATAAGLFDSGGIANGKSWSHVAAKAGKHDYVCTYHPGMKATVVVQ